MNPPSREATREALIWDDDIAHALQDERGIMQVPMEILEVLIDAARAWERIAPDENGEWPDEMVDHLAKIHDDAYSETTTSADRWLRYPDKRDDHRAIQAVLAELVRLAGETE